MTEDSDIDQEPAKGQRNEMRMIARASAVLRALADHPSGLSLGQIAKATGLARATVQRLVGALENERLVSTAAGVPGVRLGVELARLGAAVHRDLRDLFRPVLTLLWERLEETIDLTQLQGGDAVVIDQIVSPRGLRVVSFIGNALPLHCTASGKAHMTQMSAADIAKALGGAVKRWTARSQTDASSFTALAQTADARICQIDDEEYADGVCAIGLPIRGLIGGNYAIAISMPSQRFKERREMLSEELRRAQTELERLAGRDHI